MCLFWEIPIGSILNLQLFAAFSPHSYNFLQVLLRQNRNFLHENSKIPKIFNIKFPRFSIFIKPPTSTNRNYTFFYP